MHRNQQSVAAGDIVTLLLMVLNAVVLEQGLVSNPRYYQLAFVTFPLLLIAMIAFRKKS